ncbi:MAG: dihydrofolate reductase [Halobacteriales archaeon]
MEVALIAAVAENGVIGADGTMPWELPADLRRFKATTMGHPVIVGRRTFEAIADRLGGPLPGRTNIVLSRGDPDLPEGVVLAGSVEAALEAAKATGAATAYVAGGGAVYEQFLPRADRLVLTEVDAAPEGDTRFPEWDREAWTEVEREGHEGFAFVEYVRRD